MAQRVPNTFHYSTPLGQAFSNIAGAIMSGPSKYERDALEADAVYRRAKAKEAETSAELDRGKINAPSALADAFARQVNPAFAVGGAPPPAVQKQQRLADIIRATAQAGEYGDLDSVLRATIANTPGATDHEVSRAMLGAGDDYATTPTGMLAEIFAKPVEVSAGATAYGAPNDPRFQGGPLAGRDTETTALARAFNRLDPALQETAAIGKTTTPRNYAGPGGSRGVTLDGLTDAATGGRIPQGAAVYTGQQQSSDASDFTTSTKTALQGSQRELNQFMQALNQTRELALESPLNFGIAGRVKGVAQDVSVIAQGVAASLGETNIEAARERVVQEAIRNGIDPSLLPSAFDPTLPALNASADLLTYSAAAALAGQSGRSVSDRDVKMFRQIVGDPRSLFESQEKFIARLDQLQSIVAGRRAADDAFQAGQDVAAPPTPAAPTRRLRYDPASGGLVAP